MKKLLSVILATLMFGTLLTGCGSKGNDGSKEVTLNEGTTLESMVQKIGDTNEITMPTKADDAVAKDLFHLNLDDVEEYSIQYAMVMNSSDNIAMVKAKDGKVDSVKTALETRLNDVKKSFEQYLPDQKEKANNGKVVVKGNYVALLIVEKVDDAEKTFNESFK